MDIRSMRDMTLEIAVKAEWGEARSEFLAVPSAAWSDKTPFPPDIWNRLANAEQRLAHLARATHGAGTQ
jgi:hypothetical protein